MAEPEKSDELKTFGIDRLRKLLNESERLRQSSGPAFNSASDQQLKEWLKILNETSQILEQEIKRRSSDNLGT